MKSKVDRFGSYLSQRQLKSPYQASSHCSAELERIFVRSRKINRFKPIYLLNKFKAQTNLQISKQNARLRKVFQRNKSNYRLEAYKQKRLRQVSLIKLHKKTNLSVDFSYLIKKLPVQVAGVAGILVFKDQVLHMDKIYGVECWSDHSQFKVVYTLKGSTWSLSLGLREAAALIHSKFADSMYSFVCSLRPDQSSNQLLMQSSPDSFAS